MAGAPADIIIIGGGISGLSLAHYCAKAGVKPLVLEKSARPGGCVHTVIPGATQSGDGFWLELGAHTCYNSYGNLIAMAEELGLKPQIRARKRLPFRMWSKKGPRSIAASLDWWEGARAIPRLFWTQRQGGTIHSFFSTIAGDGNYQRVVGPAMNAVICQDADEFPADLVFKKRPRRKDLPRGFTFNGGLDRLITGLVQQPEIQFRAESVVTALGREGALFCIHLQNGEELRARRIALATPAPVASKLFEGLSLELAKHLAKIRTRTLESIGVVLPTASVGHRLMAGLIFPSTQTSEPAFSAVSRDTIPDPARRGMTFHFKPRVLDLDGKLARIRECLSGAPLTALATAEHEVPALRLGHTQWTAKLEELQRAEGFGDRLVVTGNYFQGLALEDCIGRSQTEANRICSPGMGRIGRVLQAR